MMPVYATLGALAGTWFHRATKTGAMPLPRVLGLLGLKMSSDMKNRVLEGAGIPPPNAPTTIRQKLKKGDRVITSGGIYGEIYALTPSTVTLMIAENVKVKVSRGFISGLATPEEDKAGQ